MTCIVREELAQPGDTVTVLKYTAAASVGRQFLISQIFDGVKLNYFC